MKQGLKRVLTFVLVSVLLGGSAYVGLLYFRQDSIIYYPREYAGVEVEAFGQMGGKQLAFETSQGRQVAFFWGPQVAAAPPGRVWVCFGGNGALALGWMALLQECDRRDAGFLLVDYPGYGMCEGTPNPDRVAESIDGALAACAAEFGIAVDDLAARVAVLGHSLGCSAALMTAEKCGATEIVLVSPFTSMMDMARRMVPGPLAGLLRHRYDNRALLETITATRPAARVTILHGTDDNIIPVSMGRELAAEFSDAVTYHEIPRAGHNDIIYLASERLLDLLAERAAAPATEDRSGGYEAQTGEGSGTPRTP